MTTMMSCREILRLAVSTAGLAAVSPAVIAQGVAQAHHVEGRPEYLENGKLATTERRPVVIYGPIELRSPEESEGGIGEVLECETIGLGTVYNATEPGGGPLEIRAYGSILAWWASGTTPTPEHREASSNCRLVHHGTSLGTEKATWVTAEPPLKEPKTEAVVCVHNGKPLSISECGEPGAERETEILIKEVKREALSLPWEVEAISSEGHADSRIGVPDAEERAKGRRSCEEFLSPEIRMPSGCMKLQIVVPELAIDDPFEGNLTPQDINGVKNALAPSVLYFEGEGREPCLHFALNTEKCLYVHGGVRFIGFVGQELITYR
jgi:hypothetical protein